MPASKRCSPRLISKSAFLPGQGRGAANAKTGAATSPVLSRKDTLKKLADGSLSLVVGTHALLSESVAFHDLGLAVVDEQHRFGVRQRIILGEKGAHVDVMVMTATPIPRSLCHDRLW